MWQLLRYKVADINDADGVCKRYKEIDISDADAYAREYTERIGDGIR